MRLQTIQRVSKIIGIALVVFGIGWIILIILFPDLELLRDIPLGGISLLFAFVVFAFYLRVR